ncbi:MAG: hypothetical protein ACI83O_000125 [Patescibacteria group bacterium]|jgi:hypothetical protein
MRDGVKNMIGFAYLVAILGIVFFNYSSLTVTGFVVSGNETTTAASSSGILSSDLFWFWVIMIAVIFFAILVVGSVVYYLFFKGSGGDRRKVTKPSWDVPMANHVVPPIALKEPAETLQYGNVAKPEGLPPVAVAPVKPQSLTVQKVPVRPDPAVAPSTPAKGVAPTPVAPDSLSGNLRYIWYYAQGMSTNPKVRIRYLIKQGTSFVGNRDLVTAKRIYRFISDEYQYLERHDQPLYSEIVAFYQTLV